MKTALVMVNLRRKRWKICMDRAQSQPEKTDILLNGYLCSQITGTFHRLGMGTWKYSDVETIQYHNGELLKNKERAHIIDKLTTERENNPVKNYTDMRKTINWLQQKLHTRSLHACDNILEPKQEGRDPYEQ